MEAGSSDVINNLINENSLKKCENLYNNIFVISSEDSDEDIDSPMRSESEICKDMNQIIRPQYPLLLLEETELAEFFYSLDVSFDLIVSPRFRIWLQNLDPSYLLPEKRRILTDLLTTTYRKCVYNKTVDEKEAILLLYGIYPQSQSKYILACIIIDNSKHFLQIWESNFDNSSDFVNKLIMECQTLAKNVYNARYYMILSDYPELKLTSPIWTLTCQSVIVENFAHGISSVNLITNVEKSLKLMEKYEIDNLFEIINPPLILYINKNWSTLRDMFGSYLLNIKNFQKFLKTNPNLEIPEDLSNFIFDTSTAKEVHKNFILLKKLQHLINCSQNNNSLLAEITNLWLSLKIKGQHSILFKTFQNQALSIYGLAANYLDPKYKGKHLSFDQKKTVKTFLKKILSEEGKYDLILYRKTKRIFRILNKKLDSITYWNTAEKTHKDLSKIAKKILICPSSLFQLEILLKKFVQIHGDLRNLLGLTQFRKLAKIFFTYKFQTKDIQPINLNT